jgi:hypothetical protein
MLLIAEIGLTVWAWMRGWKGYALLPVGIALPVGFILGLIVGAGGGGTQSILVYGLALDVIVIAVLIFMVAKPRNVAAALPMAAVAGGGAWHADPTGRHEHRYWDGTAWTDQVSDAGVQSSDPMQA